MGIELHKALRNLNVNDQFKDTYSNDTYKINPKTNPATFQPHNWAESLRKQ